MGRNSTLEVLIRLESLAAATVHLAEQLSLHYRNPEVASVVIKSYPQNKKPPLRL